MIRLLHEHDLAAYAALRRESLLESPLAFGASPETDVAAAQIGGNTTIFGAFVGDGLAGAAGLMRGRHAKSAHLVSLWGMYVSPPHRGTGLGRALLDACIAHARTVKGVEAIQLAVTDTAASARRLYERAGFVTWGVQPDALRHGGRSVSEHHMLLRLNPESSENTSV
ncbi:MAG TPA: GNAT family N-acetyltransferase [Thermoanaerobaculia bacterium]